MGIKGLNKIINQYSPSAVSHVNISEFSGSKIAIDSELLLHKFKSNESENSHIYGFINNIFWYLKNGIVPVYVFDGSPNIAKQTNVIAKRSNYKEQLYQRVEEIENKIEEHLESEKGAVGDALSSEFNSLYDKLSKLQKKVTCMSVTKKHRNECKYLLKLLGVPYVVADEDAEAYCIVLQRKNLVDYIYTEDTDIIPYYVASLVVDNTSSSKPIKILRTTNYSKNPFYLKENNYDFCGYNKYDTISVLDINKVIEQLKMSKETIIDMCIVAGCDFCTCVPKINHEKVYNLMKKFETIENLVCSNDVHVPLDFKYKEARDIFYKNYDQINVKSVSLSSIDVNGLREYLSVERNINTFLIDSIISKYHKTVEIYNKKIKSL
jgi:flap endonuclease-1